MSFEEAIYLGNDGCCSAGVFRLASDNLSVEVILIPPDEFSPELFDQVAYHLSAMGELISEA